MDSDMSQYYEEEMSKNKPQRPPMKPRTKKIIIYILCAVIGIGVAAGAIFVYNELYAGADTPQEAVADYLKASLLYDVDGMIEYSSDYNKTVLFGNRESTSDPELREYLVKGYEGYEARYTESEISFQLVSVMEYEPNEAKFEEIMQKYIQKDADARETVDTFAIVEMVVIKGDSKTTTNYLAVNSGTRWFYGYAGA